MVLYQLYARLAIGIVVKGGGEDGRLVPHTIEDGQHAATRLVAQNKLGLFSLFVYENVYTVVLSQCHRGIVDGGIFVAIVVQRLCLENILARDRDISHFASSLVQRDV